MGVQCSRYRGRQSGMGERDVARQGSGVLGLLQGPERLAVEPDHTPPKLSPREHRMINHPKASVLVFIVAHNAGQTIGAVVRRISAELAGSDEVELP